MKKNNTIIYYSVAQFPDKNAAAQRVLANAMILRELGFDVVLVGFTSEANKVGVHNFSGFVCHLLLYPAGFSWFSYLWGDAQLFEICELYKSSLSALFFYNFPSAAQYRVMHKTQDLGIKYVSDITEWYDSSAGSYVYRALKWMDTICRIKFIAKKSDGVITTSSFMTSFYQERDKVTVEIPTLYDCMNTVTIPETPEDSSGEPLKFIYFGSPFHPQLVNKKRSNLKDRLDKVIVYFDLLVQSDSHMILHIYGITKEKYLAVFSEHEALLERLKQHIIFEGIVPHTTICDVLPTADFSIFFKDDNLINRAGFPSKLAESISYGTPVVVNEVPSLQNYRDVAGILTLANTDNVEALKTLRAIAAEKWTYRKKLLDDMTFDYRNFIVHVGTFLTSIGLVKE